MTQVVNFVKVTAVSDVKLDKNDKAYRTISVSQTQREEVFPGVFAEGKTITNSFNAYETNYLGEADEAFNWKVGEIKLGSIVIKQVTPYDVTGSDSVVRVVNTYTAFVLGDTRNVKFEKDVTNTFKNRGHIVIETKVETVATVEELIEAII